MNWSAFLEKAQPKIALYQNCQLEAGALESRYYRGRESNYEVGSNCQHVSSYLEALLWSQHCSNFLHSHRITWDLIL